MQQFLFSRHAVQRYQVATLQPQNRMARTTLLLCLTTLSSHTTSSSCSSCAFALRSVINRTRFFHDSFSTKAASDMSSEHQSSAVDMDDSNWYDMIQRTVLPLNSQGHKGCSGRVAIVGGSAMYTGAPYYASMAALKVGSDLTTVFCASEASIPIKCYSPELMVLSAYEASTFDALVRSGDTDTDEANTLVDGMVNRVAHTIESLHALVIGPGLGRCPLVLEAAARIIQIAMDQNLPLVIDADALFLLTLPAYQDLLKVSPSSGASSVVVLTPNAIELRRLAGKEFNWDKDRVVVVEKGKVDIISYHVVGEKKTLRCYEAGGLKRSGGIGDILAGTLGTFLAWNNIMTKSGRSSRHDVPLACWMACCLIKRSTREAFEQYHRAMSAPDILPIIGPTFQIMTK